MRPGSPSLQRCDSKAHGHRIGQQQEWKVAFRGQDGKAIHEVVCGIKSAYEVDGEDTNGMKTAKRTIRGGSNE